MPSRALLNPHQAVTPSPPIPSPPATHSLFSSIEWLMVCVSFWFHLVLLFLPFPYARSQRPTLSHWATQGSQDFIIYWLSNILFSLSLPLSLCLINKYDYLFIYIYITSSLCIPLSKNIHISQVGYWGYYWYKHMGAGAPLDPDQSDLRDSYLLAQLLGFT